MILRRRASARLQFRQLSDRSPQRLLFKVRVTVILPYPAHHAVELRGTLTGLSASMAPAGLTIACERTSLFAIL